MRVDIVTKGRWIKIMEGRSRYVETKLFFNSASSQKMKQLLRFNKGNIFGKIGKKNMSITTTDECRYPQDLQCIEDIYPQEHIPSTYDTKHKRAITDYLYYDCINIYLNSWKRKKIIFPNFFLPVNSKKIPNFKKSSINVQFFL